MKQSEATLFIEVWVDCPHCEEYFNITDQLYEMEVDVHKSANTDEMYNVCCPECGNEFQTSINY